jgi:predicted ribosomally synthesized peptide with nif11-like leader
VSDNNTMAFIEQLNKDSTLRSKVQALPTGDLSALISFAAEIGYTFTAEEWRQATSVFAGELDDAALDRIAGGALNAYLESPSMDGQASGYMRSVETSHNAKNATGGSFAAKQGTRGDSNARPDQSDTAGTRSGRPDRSRPR